MGIDGIGKNGKNGPAPPSHSEPSRGTRPAGADRPFELTVPEPAQTPTASGRAVAAGEISRSAVHRLRTGDLDAKGYVELKVNDATEHLKALPPSELEAIRNALRTRMASDPSLVELVRTATGGQSPEPPSED